MSVESASPRCWASAFSESSNKDEKIGRTLAEHALLILAHVKELLEQTAEKLRIVCPEVAFGIYSAGLKRRDTEAPVIIAGIQSVYRRACELDAFDLVLVDECHLIPIVGDGMYPIDPMPEGPLPAKYDLLIYAKNGHRPGLLEHLAELYPNHIQFHYGQYKRADLIEAARRSRACAYLADDDHGPLALQEILLAGCPSVGVRTGASLVTEPVTGLFVDRLPPGQNHIAGEIDSVALSSFVETISRTSQLDRRRVQETAIETFEPSQITDRVVNALTHKCNYGEKTMNEVVLI